HPDAAARHAAVDLARAALAAGPAGGLPALARIRESPGRGERAAARAVGAGALAGVLHCALAPAALPAAAVRADGAGGGAGVAGGLEGHPGLALAGAMAV